jgi:hypothetical protein
MTDDAMAVGRQVFGPLAVEMLAAIDGYTRQEQELVIRFLTDVLDATARATRPGRRKEPSDPRSGR